MVISGAEVAVSIIIARSYLKLSEISLKRPKIATAAGE
jgi:hypothetical protein